MLNLKSCNAAYYGDDRVNADFIIAVEDGIFYTPADTASSVLMAKVNAGGDIITPPQHSLILALTLLTQLIS